MKIILPPNCLSSVTKIKIKKQQQKNNKEVCLETSISISHSEKMACHSDKKRFRQDSSDPEAACQKCDKIITESVICQGCKLDYCVACAKISPTLFECLRSGEMNDFYWSCTSCRTTLPTLDNITGMLKDMQKDSNERMTRLETRVTSPRWSLIRKMK